MGTISDPFRIQNVPVIFNTDRPGLATVNKTTNYNAVHPSPEENSVSRRYHKCRKFAKAALDFAIRGVTSSSKPTSDAIKLSSY